MMNIFYRIYCVIYPERCPYCGDLIKSQRIACERCLEKLDELQKPIIRGTLGYRCVSSFVYDNLVKRMILRVKYYDRIQYLNQVAAVMAKDIRAVYGDYHFDIITSVPAHKKDLKERGYNQAEILAKCLSKQLSIPYADTLIKVKRTKKQQRLKYEERKKNLIGAFKIIDKDAVKGKRILMIDDIITTGATLGICCKTLSRAKPTLLCCATIATTQHILPNEATI